MLEITVIDDEVHIKKLLSDKKTLCEDDATNGHKDNDILDGPMRINDLKLNVEVNSDYKMCDDCLQKNNKVKKILRYIIVFSTSVFAFLLLYFVTY